METAPKEQLQEAEVGGRKGRKVELGGYRKEEEIETKNNIKGKREIDTEEERESDWKKRDKETARERAALAQYADAKSCACLLYTSPSPRDS